ncbi:hypothetical protein DCAR_0625930 [Daucus carota subsp. sativus]|uniref:Uncharacterized protein n=1 Tax=Daucus carota subsp. sativus TaxID=79200 RepID=A0A164WRZ5_DAUCS|nr:hypothetical protein DCAR_0625930 [Daucus carota subsp. sativus]
MAQVSSFVVKAILVVVLAAVAVSGQEAPAPSPDVGAGFSLPVSTAVVGTSLILSLLALVRN